jgi:hypothetical protein
MICIKLKIFVFIYISMLFQMRKLPPSAPINADNSCLMVDKCCFLNHTLSLINGKDIF